MKRKRIPFIIVMVTILLIASGWIAYWVIKFDSYDRGARHDADDERLNPLKAIACIVATAFIFAIILTILEYKHPRKRKTKTSHSPLHRNAE